MNAENMTVKVTLDTSGIADELRRVGLAMIDLADELQRDPAEALGVKP